MDHIFFQMSERAALIVTIAYLFTRVKASRRLLRHNINIKDRIQLTIVFGLIAILGTYSAIEIKGALANSRVIGAVAAGLLGGPWLGVGAGLISGLHRWSLGGFTGFACALSTFTEGLIAGLIHNLLKGQRIGWEVGLLTGFVTESIQMIIILLVAKPFSASWELVKIIGFPMIIWNSIGIALFMTIIKNAQEEEERIGALHAQKALTIANNTLKYLRNGLNRETAQAVARVIKQHTDVSAIAITDTSVILAHEGEGEDHHLPGQPLMTEATRWVINNSDSMIANSKKEINCSSSSCPLKSSVIVPLFSRDKVIGSLKLYHNKENAISSLDLEFAKGLAHLFSTQLEISSLEQQRKLLKEAELQALQAQINPHFLFNALNTIISFSRADPEKSRVLLRHLGDFFRKSILKDKKMITLAEELERIDAYLSIEKARFGERLQVYKDIDPLTLSYSLPPLILQPLVENCIKHGILPQPKGGAVYIKTQLQNDSIKITVEDNGVGMPPNVLNQCLNNNPNLGAGIGLRNVNERLFTIFGAESTLCVESLFGKGTIFSIKLPLNLEGGKI